VDILSTFCGVFVVHCVKLMLRIFELGVLLLDYCVYRQNTTHIKRLFHQVRALAGKAENIIVLSPKSLCQKLERLAEV